MTNERYLKSQWIEKIESLTVDEVYEILTGGDGLFGERICKFCEQVYEPCKEDLANDNICRERFAKWYMMQRECVI